MNCGEAFPVEGMLRFDARCCGPLAITWDGREWRHWCSAYCAAFGRHVANVKVSEDGLTWDIPQGASKR